MATKAKQVSVRVCDICGRESKELPENLGLKNCEICGKELCVVCRVKLIVTHWYEYNPQLEQNDELDTNNYYVCKEHIKEVLDNLEPSEED